MGISSGKTGGSKIKYRCGEKGVYCDFSKAELAFRIVELAIVSTPTAAFQRDLRDKPKTYSIEEQLKDASRLADFLSNCQPSAQSLSGCFRENYAACLLSYSGLIGSDMTPNYIDATDIVVAPWCTCSGSGNQKEECDKFLNYFKVNACLRNAMQAFGNGTDVNMWKTSLPTLATLLLKTEKTIESAQPSDHIKEITTADDANIFTMCSDLQENGPKFNTSKEQSLCLPEAQAPALNKDKIKDMDQMPSYTDPRNGHSFGARVRASEAWVAISFYILTTLTS
ncbi:GDNF family receptor alpha-2-like [Cetorhinus maximus]